MSSFGLCCFRKKNNCEPEVLILRRRYTYNFCTYLYSSFNTVTELKNTLNGTTIDEKIVIYSGDFDRLWDKVWVGYRPERYTKIRTKYENITRAIGLDNIRKMLEEASSTELQWELPKGRKDSSFESDVECACREFSEETTLPRDSFKVSIDRNTRCYIKDDKVLYTMKFWGAIMKTDADPKCSLANKSHHEHDLIKFVSVSRAGEYLSEQTHGVVKRLYRGIKGSLR